jgi:hypothetical protein
MAKRFIDTEVWQSERFLDASIETKLLTIYLFTNCNYIGVFKKSLRLVSFEVGFTVTKELVLDCPVDIEVLPDGSFWLSSFCFFQYGELKEACRPHKKYIAELKKVGLFERVSKGYQKGINTLEEQEQDKEEEKEEDEEVVNRAVGCEQGLFIEPVQEVRKKDYSERFENFWANYERHGNKKTAGAKFEKLTESQKVEMESKYMEYVNNTNTNGVYPSRKNAETYLNDDKEHWNDIVIKKQQRETPQDLAKKREFEEPEQDISMFMLN